jgi:hypothetical protein
VIRGEERAVLEKGAYVQSISTATAPIVPVIGSVFTFLAYVLTGNELTAVKVRYFNSVLFILFIYFFFHILVFDW